MLHVFDLVFDLIHAPSICIALILTPNMAQDENVRPEPLLTLEPTCSPPFMSPTLASKSQTVSPVSKIPIRSTTLKPLANETLNCRAPVTSGIGRVALTRLDATLPLSSNNYPPTPIKHFPPRVDVNGKPLGF